MPNDQYETGPGNVGGPNQTTDNRAYSTQQKIQMVQTICEGPILGLVHGASSVYFNNNRATPLENGSFSGEEETDSGQDRLALGTISFDGSSTTGTVNITAGGDSELNEQLVRSYDTGTRFIVLDGLVSFDATVTAKQSVGNKRPRIKLTLSASQFDGDLTTGGLVPYENSHHYLKIIDHNGNYIMRSYNGGEYNNGTWTFYYNPEGGFDLGLSGDNSTVRVEALYKCEISEIPSTTSITLAQSSNPTASPTGGYSFYLTWQFEYGDNPDLITEYSPIKTKDLSVDFRTGALYQNPINTWNGTGGGIGIPTVNSIPRSQLKQLQATAASTLGITLDSTSGYLDSGSNSADGAADATYIRAGTWGGQAGTIAETADQISFEIRYNRLQTFDSDNAVEKSQTARYSMGIRFKLRGNTDYEDNYRTLFGGIVEHTATFNAPLSWDHTIDLRPFRDELGDFIDFEIRIVRLSRHLGRGVAPSGADWGGTGDAIDRFKAGDSTGSLFNVTAFLVDKLYYPFTAHSGVSFNSTQFPQLPKVSYEVRGKLVKIPSAYTPREYTENNIASYAPFWDGSFKDKLYYTDNPAWVFYDILTNPRYGLGNYISELDIDKYSLFRIAKYCDELVPSGKKDSNGNDILEPRFRSNVFLAKATDAYKVLKDMATTFLGILYWMDTQVTPVADVPSDPVYNFSKANVIDGEFQYQSTGNKTKANQVIVTWNDPEKNYEPVPLVVEDRRAIVKEGRINTLSAVAFGATSEGQATRYGRWKLWTAQNQTELVSFRTALNGAFLRPGDVINVSDADRYGSSFAGRLKSATSSGVTLDREITLNSNANYKLNILDTTPAAYHMGDSISITNVGSVGRGEIVKRAYVDNDGAGSGTSRSLVDINTEERASNAWSAPVGGYPLSLSWKPYTHVASYDITNTGNTTSTLSLTSGASFDNTPSASSVWSLNEISGNTETLDSAQLFKILSISQEAENIYSITAAEYHASKYKAVDEGYSLGSIPDRLWFVPEAPPAPRYVAASQISSPSMEGDELKVIWDAPTVRDHDASSGASGNITEVEFKDIGYWELNHNVPGYKNPLYLDATARSKTFIAVPDGEYKFDCRIVSSTGDFSPYKTSLIKVRDPFGLKVERLNGIAKGGVLSSTAFVQEGQTENGIWRTDDKVFAASAPQSLGTIVTSNPSNEAQYSLDVTALEGGQYQATSTTSNSIGTGTKSFTVLSGLPYSAGMVVTATASGGTLTGTVSTYSGTALTINVTSTTGSGTYNSWSINRSGYSPTQYEWTLDNGFEFTNDYGGTISRKPVAYILCDASAVGSGSEPAFKLVSKRGEDDAGRPFWYDVKKYITAGQSIYTSLSGTANIAKNSPRVEGTGTSFTTDLNILDWVQVAVGYKARVAYIESDTVMYLDTVFDTAFSNEGLQVNNVDINFYEDFLVGSVTYDSTNDKYVYQPFSKLDPNLDIGKSLIVDSNTAFLNYADDNEADQPPQTIKLKALAIGYIKPEFKMTWTSSDLAGGDSSDTAFNVGNYPTGNTATGIYKQEYEKTIFSNATTPIAYGDGSSITVSVTVREQDDPENTRKQRTAQWTIVKSKNAATGLDARVVSLTAEDYSIVYDSQGANPSFNSASSDGDIDFTANTGNFVNPLFRWTIDGTVYQPSSGQSWSNTTNAAFTVPNSISSFGAEGGTKVVQVEVAEEPSNWNQSAQTPTIQSSDILATDSASILAVRTGAGGAFISLSNPTAAIACNNAGTPLVGTSTAVAGSGTTIEVFYNGQALNFETQSNANAGDFYVTIVNNSDITEGALSGAGSGTIATVGNHIFGSGADDQEVIEYQITIKAAYGLSSDLTLSQFQTFSKAKGGQTGSSSALVYLYKASATSPSMPSSSFPDTRVDLTTGTITTGDPRFEDGDQGWYKSPNGPTVSATQSLWVIAATANGSGTTDDIAHSEWNGPAQFSGEDGFNSATVELFLVNNSSSTPDLPDADVTYTFATGAISGTPGNGWSSTASSISVSNKYLWKTTAAAISQAATSVIDGTDGNDGTDWSTPVLVGFFGEGSIGEDAVAVKLTSPDYSIVYDQYDSPSPSGTLTLTAEAQNLTTPWFKFTGDGISDDSAFASANTKTFTIPGTPFTTPKNIQVEVSDGSSTQTQQTQLARDTISIAGISSASDGYTIVNTNSAHTIPVDTGDTDGSTGVYTGSGTAIEVYKGSTQLTPVAASATPTTGQFNVTATGTNITKGDTESVSSSTKQYTIDEASAMNAAIASISYAINVENLETLTSIQTFSKSFEGVAGQDNKQLVLGVDHNTFVRQKRGTISPSAIKFTADKINIGTGSPSWSTNPSHVSLYAAATGGSAINKSTFTGDAVYVRPSAFALSSVPESVSVTANLTYNSVTYTDTESIELLTEASDEITVVLTNDNVSIPANKNGVASSYASTGTTISVFEGSYRLDYDPSYDGSDETWTVSPVESQTGGADDITVGAISESSGNTKNAVVANASAMPDARTAASITFNVSGKKRDGTAFTATKVQTFSKINTGQDGSTGESVNIIFGRFSTAPGAPADSASPNNNIGWYDDPPSDNGNPLYASRGTKAVDATVFDWGTPYRVDGESVAELYIYSNSITGDAPDLPGTNNTTASTFNFTSSTLTINGPSNTWNSSPPSLGGNGHKVYVSVGLVTGTPGDTAATVSWSTAAVYAQQTDGSTGGSVDLVFKRSSTDLSSDAQYIPADSSGVPTGWSGSPPSDNGNPLFASRGTKAVGATQFEWTQPYRVDGDSVAEVYFYSNVTTEGAPQFSAPTYNFATNSCTAPTNWNKSPPSLTADGQKIWVLVVLYASTPGDTSATAVNTVSASNATIFAQRTDGDPSKLVNLTTTKYVLDYTSAGTRNAENLTLTANAQNFTAPRYRFTWDGSDDEDTFEDQDDFSTANTATFAVPTAFSATPYTFQVEVKEQGAADNTALTDSITISSVKATNKQKTVFIFKRDDSSVGFGTDGNGDPFDASDQTYANPTTGLESGWSETNPGLAATNEAKVYMSNRIFTDDGLDPQQPAWSTPAIVAQRDDGNNTAVAEIFVLSTSGTSAPATGFGSGDNLTYNFSQAKITSDVPGNYTATAGSVSTSAPYLWKRTAPASSASNTVTIAYNAWSNGVLIGSLGPAGDINKTVKLYQLNTNTSPSPPGNTEGFNTSDGTAQNITNWSKTAPAPTTTQYVIVAEGVVTKTHSSTTFAMTQNWAVSVHASRVALDPDVSKTVKLYKRGASPPTDPVEGTGFVASTGAAVNITDSNGNVVWSAATLTPTTTQDVYVSEAVVTQSNGTGNFSMTQDWVTSLHAARQATNGTSGFFYITRSDSGVTTNTPGTDLGAPSGTEFPNPTQGQIAIVQNSGGTQQGWLRGTDAWSTQQIVNEEIIFANAIGADQMQISNNEADSNNAGIFLAYNGGNSKITISDSTRVRVKIGYLG